MISRALVTVFMILALLTRPVLAADDARKEPLVEKVKKAIEGQAQNWIEIAAEEYVHLSRSYIEEGIDAART